MVRALALVVIAISIPIWLTACEAATPQAEEEGSQVEQAPLSEAEELLGQELSGTEDDTSSGDRDIPRGQGPRQGFGLQEENPLTAVVANELGMTVEELISELGGSDMVAGVASD